MGDNLDEIFEVNFLKAWVEDLLREYQIKMD